MKDYFFRTIILGMFLFLKLINETRQFEQADGVLHPNGLKNVNSNERWFPLMNHFVWLMFLFLECVYFGFFGGVAKSWIEFRNLIWRIAFGSLQTNLLYVLYTHVRQKSILHIGLILMRPASVQPFAIYTKTATKWKYRNPFWSNWKLIRKQTSITHCSDFTAFCKLNQFSNHRECSWVHPQ